MLCPFKLKNAAITKNTVNAKDATERAKTPTQFARVSAFPVALA